MPKSDVGQSRFGILRLTAAGRRQLRAGRSRWSELSQLSEVIGRILARPAESES